MSNSKLGLMMENMKIEESSEPSTSTGIRRGIFKTRTETSTTVSYFYRMMPVAKYLFKC